jgi:hypothetical protein
MVAEEPGEAFVRIFASVGRMCPTLAKPMLR